jgi:hypothetical protein
VILRRDTRDVAAGLVFAGIGGVVYALALDYPFGRTARLGPGYFPQILALGLIGLGLLIAVRGALRRAMDPAPIPWIDLAIAGAMLAVPALLGWGFAFPPRDGLIVGAGAGAALAFLLGRREFALILAPLVVAALALETIGLAAGALLIVGLSGWAAHDAKPREIAVASLALAVFAILVFAWGLGIPVPIWPRL